MVKTTEDILEGTVFGFLFDQFDLGPLKTSLSLDHCLCLRCPTPIIYPIYIVFFNTGNLGTPLKSFWLLPTWDLKRIFAFINSKDFYPISSSRLFLNHIGSIDHWRITKYSTCFKTRYFLGLHFLQTLNGLSSILEVLTAESSIFIFLVSSLPLKWTRWN